MNQTILARMMIALGLFACFFFVLIGRLVYIQLWATENFSSKQINLLKQAVSQRQQEFILHSGRGDILDRNGRSFTSYSKYVLVFYPFSQKTAEFAQGIAKLANFLQVPQELLAQFSGQLKEPKIYRTDQGVKTLNVDEAKVIEQLNIPGVMALPYEFRYSLEQRVAQHLIGQLGQNAPYVQEMYQAELAQGWLKATDEIGISGLEQTFQPFLQSSGPSSLAYLVDGRGYPLPGMEVKYMDQDNPFYPLQIETTLDFEIQTVVEQIMDQQGIVEGAVLVLDPKENTILAMASRPNFQHQKENVTAWENKALIRYPLGSIFKIVVAAAALEEGLVAPQTLFDCQGHVEGTNFHCWKKEGHGRLNFAEAFAQSCNVVFGELASQLGPDTLEKYAGKLGLTEENGWHTAQLFHVQDFSQLDREEKGQVFAAHRQDEEKEDKAYLLQTGIGQLDVQATPLAVGNMLSTIIRSGEKQQVRAVQAILYQTGGSFQAFHPQSMEGELISPYTAYQLRQLLALVPKKGTAQTWLQAVPWSSAGKTGTAQVLPGRSTSNVFRHHHWFAGYYPEEKPKYVIVTLVLNQAELSTHKAVPLFAAIVDWLEAKQNRPS